MKCHFVRKVQTLVVFASLTVGFAMLLGLASAAQETKSDQGFEKVSAVSGAFARADFGRGYLGTIRNGRGRLARSNPDASLLLPAVTYATGGGDEVFFDDATWVSVEDVNGDGKPDVIVANWCSTQQDNDCPGNGNVGVLLNNGDGTFKPVQTYTSGGHYTFNLVVADVNGDGKPDLVLANGCLVGVNVACPTTGSVGVLLGNGDGTFQAVRNYSSAGLLSWLAVADVNGDGKPDLLITNQNGGTSGQGSAGVLLGKGDGTFLPVETYTSGGLSPDFVTVVDTNADGKLDLIVSNPFSCTNCNDGNVGVFLGNGDGTFRPAVNYSSGFGINEIATADINDDGKLDLVINAGGWDDGGEVIVMLGNGDGSFKAPTGYASGGGYNSSPVLVDLNGDHKLDLLLANGQGCPNAGNLGCVGVLMGNGDGTFQPAVQYGFGVQGAMQMVVADLDGDGKADVVAASQCDSKGCAKQHGTITTLLGNGDGTFQTAVSYSTGAALSTWVGTADVNGDGRLDVLSVSAVNIGSGGANGVLSVFLNNSTGLPPTTTIVASSLNPSNLGQSVSFTATVSASTGTPTGTVVFYDGTTSIGSANLAGGTASLATSALAAGSHSITAAYQGSTNFGSSTSATLIQLVNGTGTATTTTLTSSKNPSIYQTPVTFTAVVTASSGTPTGTVTFFDGSAALGNGTLASGTASFTTSALVRGPHSITASYLGEGNFAPSVSTVLDQVVNLGGLFNTQTKLNHPGTAFVGQPITFLATVTSKGGAIPDGDTVTFSDESLGNLGMGTTHGGVASFTTSTLSPRSHIIGALYNGDANFNTSFTQITQVVNKYPTTTVLTSSLNPASYGQSITFTATVTSSGPTPTGTVRFTGIGSATLVGGVATFTKPQLRAGTYAVTADYVGDADSATSKSSVLQEVVNPSSTTTTLTSSANPSSSGQSVTFTATVNSSTGIDPFGKVTFTAGATTLGTVALKNKVASIKTSTLPTGSTRITATYGGAAGFTGSAVSLTQKVNP